MESEPVNIPESYDPDILPRLIILQWTLHDYLIL